MFCSNCGKTVDGSMNFCDSCGIPLSKQQIDKKSKSTYSLPTFVNGVLAVILGSVGMMYEAMVPVSGYARSISREYDRAVILMGAAVDRLKFLVGLGVLMIIAGVILVFVKPIKKNEVINNVLWFVPMAVSIIFVLANYGQIFSYDF